MHTTVDLAPPRATVTPLAGGALVLARVLLALIFVLGGISKFGTTGATAAQMASHGIPDANILVYGAIALELGGGLLLIAGLATRAVAVLLGLYTLALALIFHAYWTMPADQLRVQHAAFFEHLAMVGGFLYVAAVGGGAFSLDALLRRRAR